MKKVLYILVLSLFFVSCDFILKPHDKETPNDSIPENVVLGNDKDDKGCVTSAGYMWSVVRNGCIRVFEEGYRLAPYHDAAEAEEDDNEQATLNAYVLFDEKKEVAEVFLPNSQESVLLQQQNDGTTYVRGSWILETLKSYTLKDSGKIKFVSAIAEEKKITGSDNAE